MTTAPTAAPDSQVDVVLDLRHWPTPTDGQEALVGLWQQLEPALHAKPLAAGSTHVWESESGRITVEIMRVDARLERANADTHFAIAAVRQRSALVYRCAVCERGNRSGYGSFRCRGCADAGRPDRICVDHAVVLDGALLPSCADHRPSCRGCARTAVFWCSGRDCRATVAWCAEHRRRHPQDPDTDYCPDCYDHAFPVCERPGCQAVGTARCDWLDPAGHSCGRSACTRHAHRWQVFGYERVGIGLCRQHHQVHSLTADEILWQICGTAGRRRGQRMPSLAAFGHNLRTARHVELAVDYRSIRARLSSLHTRLSAMPPSPALRAVERAAPDWDRQLEDLMGTAQQGEVLVERLRALVRELDHRFGAELAAGLTLAEYKPPRPPEFGGGLWVRVPEHLIGKFIGPQGSRIKDYTARLGLKVDLHGRRRTSR
ncbi:KH domain-containing protein [Streptomyces caeruleatus]|uniref:K Homology domain-containing protein n=1 Tax=Streptomyces caeruleatus TaxID=661399 RepID=A0A101TR15_9ACTN|nr:KH domain-containing protein [Streptomyces caeruleatus]KUN96877.1 hypothetical protein AQJ67_32415 [Streptomyces caeruleatus]